jgi:tRNA nucleotidyltransferase/poly(A) polymerase
MRSILEELEADEFGGEDLEEAVAVEAVPVDPEMEKVAKRDSDWTSQALAITSIQDQQMFALVTELSAAGYELEKAYAELYEPLRKSTYQAYQDVLSERDARVKPIQKIRKEHLDKMSYDYQRRMKELEAELQRKAEEEARKAAGAARLVQAQTAKNAGASEETVEKLQNAPLTLISASKPVLVENAKGQSFKENWKARIIDESLVPDEINGIKLWIIDEKAINKLVRDSKGKIVIPGVENYAEGGVTHTRRSA